MKTDVKTVVIVISISFLCGLLITAAFSQEHEKTRKFNEALKMANAKEREGYFKQSREDGQIKSAYTRGGGWIIHWKGHDAAGAKPIDAIKATIEHLSDLQQSDLASNRNAKLLSSLIQLEEEFEVRGCMFFLTSSRL